MPTLPTTPIDPRVIAWTLACVEHALKRGETNLDLARLVKIGEGGLRMAEGAQVAPEGDPARDAAGDEAWFNSPAFRLGLQP